MLLARRVGAAILAVVLCVVVIHSGRLLLQRSRALAAEPYQPTLQQAKIMKSLNVCGLLDELQKQEPRWVSRADIINEMKANYGALPTLNKSIIVWNARIIFPQYDARGNLRSGYAVIDPAVDSFGMQKLPLIPVRKGKRAGNWKVAYGDLVTLIARIDLAPQGRPAVPFLHVSGILPGLHSEP